MNKAKGINPDYGGNVNIKNYSGIFYYFLQAKLNDSKWATLAKKVYSLANTAHSKATSMLWKKWFIRYYFFLNIIFPHLIIQFAELSNDVKALRKKFDALNFLQKIDEVAQLANKAGEIAGTVSGIVFTII